MGPEVLGLLLDCTVDHSDYPVLGATITSNKTS